MSKAIFKRRTLLKQLGAAAFLGTPVFRSVMADAQSATPLRLILAYIPGGVTYDGAESSDTGKNGLNFDSLLKPLAHLQSDTILFTGLDNPAGLLVSTFFELEGHGGGMRTIWNGSAKGQSQTSYGTATSIDQIVAQSIGQSTQFASLPLGVLWDAAQGGDHSHCWFNNGVAIAPIAEPDYVFQRLFAGGSPPPPTPQDIDEVGGIQALPVLTPNPNAATSGSGTPAMPSRAELDAYARGKSRLDFLIGQVASIKGISGTEEQAKLDQHLTSLRELEKSLKNPVGGVGGGGPAPMAGKTCQTPTIGGGSDMIETGKAMNQLAFQALNCDLTRVVTYQWLSSGDHLPRYGFLGVGGDHHGMEHGWAGAGAQGHADYAKVQGWFLQQIGDLVTLLKNTPEGSGSMLDNSLVLVSSEMATGQHDFYPVPAMIIGKAGGRLRTGQTIDAKRAPMNNLLLSVVNAMGLPLTVIGDPEYSTGTLPIT